MGVALNGPGFTLQVLATGVAAGFTLQSLTQLKKMVKYNQTKLYLLPP
jgi:hypothetical protein